MATTLGLVYEAASGLVRGTFKDVATDIGLQPATLNVKVYDRDTGTVLRADAALTPVSTYVTSAGALTFYLTAADNAIITAGKDSEIHVILFTWTWTAQAATQTGKQELQYEVINL